MSNIVEVTATNNILEIETVTSNCTNNIEITTSTTDTLEVKTGSSTSDTLVYANDVIGLGTLIGNYIDSYTIDCGTP